MTDQIPADKVREVRDLHRDAAKMVTITDAEREIHQHVADAMEALLPRPTLADMTDEERFNAVGMWADVDGFHPYRAVIDDIPAPKVPVFKPTAGSLEWAHPEDVTPLPELGRAWSPGGSPTGTPAPTPALPDGWRLADHKVYGRVIVTTEKPDDDGLLAFVHRDDDLHRGHGYDWCKPDELTYIDTDQEDTDG